MFTSFLASRQSYRTNRFKAVRAYFGNGRLFGYSISRSPIKSSRKERGFTLLEVMIALAILSVASAGLVTAAGGYLKQTQRVEDKVLAAWVADNWLNELRLADKAPVIGALKAEANMAGRQWLLKAQVSQTNSIHLKRLDIEIQRAEDGDEGAVLSLLTAFLRETR